MEEEEDNIAAEAEAEDAVGAEDVVEAEEEEVDAGEAEDEAKVGEVDQIVAAGEGKTKAPLYALRFMLLFSKSYFKQQT